MINIAICDDTHLGITVLENFIVKASQKYSISMAYEIFYDGSTLLKNIQAGATYDLIFLDVEMPIQNGIQTAKKIRALELPVLIIFVSSHDKYMKEIIS